MNERWLSGFQTRLGPRDSERHDAGVQETIVQELSSRGGMPRAHLDTGAMPKKIQP